MLFLMRFMMAIVPDIDCELQYDEQTSGFNFKCRMNEIAQEYQEPLPACTCMHVYSIYGVSLQTK